MRHRLTLIVCMHSIKGLKEAGFVEGENVAVEYRWAESQIDRLPTLAAELVRRQVPVIVAGGGVASALAARAETKSIPVLFLVAEDPVKLGLVTSLAKPDGNLTGVNILAAEVVAKRLELLRDCLLKAIHVDVLADPASATTEFKKAWTLRLELWGCKFKFSTPVPSARLMQRSLLL